MMSKESFYVEITSNYDRFWRYNLAVTCGCFDDLGKGEDNPRKDFVAAEDTIAPAGSNLTAPPQGYPAHRKLSFTTVGCDYLLMYLYVIPHTLPEDRELENCDPFGLQVKVTRGDSIVLDREFHVNCWSGASIELRLPAANTIGTAR